MTMTALQAVLMITAAAVGTMITRFLPFLAFPESKPIPKFITYLGEVLPLAVMGMLVVCMRCAIRQSRQARTAFLSSSPWPRSPSFTSVGEISW